MKNRKIAIICVIIASFLLTAGIVKAAGFTTDWLRVGKQGSGGVTYFNGTIINETTTNDVDNPVTFGDNVRIDGRVYRGATAGTSDTLPFIVNDNMEVAGDLTVDKNLSVTGNSTITGNLTVEGDITYDNSASGLTSTSVQGAIDELGVKLGNLIGGAAFTTSTGVQKTAFTSTTWKGYFYSYNKGDSDTNPCTYSSSEEITVIFTPTTETEGTFTSTPFYAFHPFYDVTSGCVATTSYRSTTPYTGNYYIIGNNIFVDSTINSITQYSSARADVRGNTMTIVDASTIPGPVITLTRQ